MYSSRLYAQNPVFEIVHHEESVRVYYTHVVVKNSIGSMSVFVLLVSPNVQQYIRCTYFASIMHEALSLCSLGIPCPFSSQIRRPLWPYAP